MEITSERVAIPLPGGATMAGYLARPSAGGVRPAVIVYMEIFGINSHIRDVTERIAREGFVALAPDYFHRTGPGMELGYDDQGMAEGMKQLGQLQADAMISDAQATVDFLRARDDVSGKLGAIGFCIGGHMTYLTACTTDIAAAASFYGGGIAADEGLGGGASTVSRSAKIQGRIECYFGEKDLLIRPSQVDQIRSALSEAGVSHEIVVYEDADHGFHCDQRGSYQEAAAKDAWGRAIAMFEETLS